jgi:hypothetical protein
MNWFCKSDMVSSTARQGTTFNTEDSARELKTNEISKKRSLVDNFIIWKFDFVFITFSVIKPEGREDTKTEKYEEPALRAHS